MAILKRSYRACGHQVEPKYPKSAALRALSCGLWLNALLQSNVDVISSALLKSLSWVLSYHTCLASRSHRNIIDHSDCWSLLASHPRLHSGQVGQSIGPVVLWGSIWRFAGPKLSSSLLRPSLLITSRKVAGLVLPINIFKNTCSQGFTFSHCDHMRDDDLEGWAFASSNQRSRFMRSHWRDSTGQWLIQQLQCSDEAIKQNATLERKKINEKWLGVPLRPEEFKTRQVDEGHVFCQRAGLQASRSTLKLLPMSTVDGDCQATEHSMSDAAVDESAFPRAYWCILRHLEAS